MSSAYFSYYMLYDWYYHIKNTQMICSGSHLTGSYMIGALIDTGLTAIQHNANWEERLKRIAISISQKKQNKTKQRLEIVAD